MGITWTLVLAGLAIGTLYGLFGVGSAFATPMLSGPIRHDSSVRQPKISDYFFAEQRIHAFRTKPGSSPRDYHVA